MSFIGTAVKELGKAIIKMGEPPAALHTAKYAAQWPAWDYCKTAVAKKNNIFIAPNATADARSTYFPRSSVWYGAQVNGASVLGEGSCVMENATVDNSTVGKNVYVGANAKVANSVIEQDSFIGAGATIGSNTTISSLSWIAAGAVVPRGSSIVGGIWAGSPAVRVREPTTDEIVYIQEAAKKTSDYAMLHAASTSREPEQIAAEDMELEEISSRNPFSSYAKNPRFLMPEDRAGLLYDRLDDDEYTGKNTGQAEEERKLSSF